MRFVLVDGLLRVFDVPLLNLPIFTPDLKERTAFSITNARLGPPVVHLAVQRPPVDPHVPQEDLGVFRGGQELVFVCIQQFDAVHVGMVAAVDVTR